jgi:hypothetical protein
MSESQTQQSPNPLGLRTHTGSCLCRDVRFEAELDLAQGASRCNCSICTKVGGSGVVVKPSAFRLLAGAESLAAYGKAGSPNARHFCKRCGTQVFGKGDVPEIGGAFVSVNVNCLDEVDIGALKIGYWDGRHDNWAAGMRPTPWPVRA